MPQPPIEASQKTLGRFGSFTARVIWDADNAEDLDAGVLLDIDVVSGKHNTPRFALTSLEWAASAGVSADIEFDSIPASSDNVIATIPLGATNGEIDWSGHVNGNLPDPNREAPGNVVITTRSAADGDELFVTGTYLEKGDTSGLG